MDNKISKNNLLKDIYYGFLHMLVAFTSIVVVSTIVGFNLPNSFLFVGIGTLVYHFITKNKVATLLGISGSYIAGMLYVSKTFGQSYVLGGIIISGIIYCIFGLTMFRWQDKVLKYIPKWLLSMAVLEIGLSLIPIGKTMISNNIIVGLIALLITSLVGLFGNKKISMFAVPIGIIISMIYKFIVYGVDLSPLNQKIGLQFIKPEFNLASFTAIGIVSTVVLAELLGDTYNSGLCMNKDIFKEVGLGRIALGNGIASIISGFGSSVSLTSYSENNGFLLLSKYTRPTAQIFTSIFFIILAFATPITKLVLLIPQESLGGVALGLYSLIAINSMKDIVSNVDLNTNKKVLSILTIMLAIFFLEFAINGVAISSMAISVLIGFILNLIIPNRIEKENKQC